MFGLFAPRPPVDIREKVWIERRLAWLIEQFGAERFRRATTVLPTREFFPLEFQASEPCAREVLDILCGHLQLPAERFELRLFEPHEAEGDEAATFEILDERRSLIRLRSDQLQDLERLIAVLAHEACHELLIRPRGTDEPPPKDDELLTDLLVVFLGLGVFGANVAVQHRNFQALSWESWEIARLGYLPARMSGYAMGQLAWLRGETSPPAWTRYLTADAATAVKNGLKYLTRTGDSVLRPENAGRPRHASSPATLAEQLRSESPTQRLDALLTLRDQPNDAAALTTGIEANLRHRNPILMAEAAETVAETRAPVDRQLLHRGLTDGEADVRQRCIRALDALKAPLEESPDGWLQRSLEQLLSDDSRAVAVSAARLLAARGPAAAESAPQLAARIVAEARDCQHESLEQLIDCLASMVGDVRSYFDQQLPDCDPDLRRLIDLAVESQEPSE